MENWNFVYQRNQKLDDFFRDKYEHTVPDMYEKNHLELLVELGELANETKCFKYWSVKSPKKDEVLEEYADCVLMTLYFFNVLNVEEVKRVEVMTGETVVETFELLFKMAIDISDCENQLQTFFSLLLSLKDQLGLTEEEIMMACYKKIEKNEERLRSTTY